MDQKFFLFKRNDPSIRGGAVFSDNGKGISVISFPTSNLAYMAADKGAITLYFNDSAPFEENSLTLAGESFEKTSVTVTCDVGKEIDFIESIIDFINRKSPSNVMRFDAEGVTNTFGKISPSPSIDTRVRSRPVERGLVGTEAIITGLTAAAVVNSIDFLKVANKPFIDFAGENITVAAGKLIETLANSGSSGSDYNATSVSGYAPLCKAIGPACSEKTIAFDFVGALDVSLNLYLNGDPNTTLDSDLTNEPSTAVLVTRGGSPVTLENVPTFRVSTNSSGVLTDLSAVKAGTGIQAGDIVTILFETNGGVTYTVQASQIATYFHHSTLNFVTVPPVPDVPFPLSDYVTYMAIVIPDGAFTQPLYTHDVGVNSLTETFANQMGPFPFDSMGDEFEVNHGEAADPSISVQSKSFASDFSDFPFKSDTNESLTSEKNLFVFVVRRDINGNVFIYNRDGDQIGHRLANENDSGSLLECRRFGLVLPFNATVPTLSIARFGIIKKDVGSLMCSNIATQLYDHYKHKHI